MSPARPPAAASPAAADAALERGRDWLRAHGPRAVVIPHGDPDGLAAGVILSRAACAGVSHLDTPWEGGLPDGVPVVVADWGVRPLAQPAVALYVDHHADPEPVEGTVVHAGATGDATTSTLAWRLVGAPAHDAWLAALGVVGDLGERALATVLPAVPDRRSLRRLATLVSAAGRLRDGPLDAAWEALVGAGGPADAVRSQAAGRLESARVEVERHRQRALRIGPRVGPGAALVLMDVPARVHSQVAAAWVRRLAPRVVVAANAGWRPGKVSFAVRSADGRDLRAWLREVFAPPPGSGDYARGHARATGGSLVPEAFAAFAAAVLDWTP